MDQKRLPLFIALSVAILLLFQYLSPPKPRPHQAVATQSTPAGQTPGPSFNPAPPGHEPEHVAPPRHGGPQQDTAHPDRRSAGDRHRQPARRTAR